MEVALPNLFDKFSQVEALVFDVDGVLTDATILVTEHGELLRRMNVRDGQAIKYAMDAGLLIGIITGGRSKGVVSRLTGLGIRDIFIGVEDKLPVFYDFAAKYGLSVHNMLYMGDDIPDVAVMRKAGIAVCPKDASPECLAAADYVTSKNGGEGCVREVIERILKIQGKWPA